MLPIFSAHLMETNADDDEQDGFVAVRQLQL
jgi:hypothetical protein